MASARLIQQCLQTIAAAHNDAMVRVDVGNYNAGRIWKLYYTLTAKGDSTADRPHRWSQMLFADPPIDEVAPDQLQALAGMAPDEPRDEVWTSLVAPRHTIDCRPWGYDLSGSGNLQTVYQGLPNSNYQHMVSMYRAVHFLIAADPKGALFYDDLEIEHLQARERLLGLHLPSVITRFVSYLTAYTNVPVVAAWGEPLWAIGLRSDGIQALDAYGDCLGAWLLNPAYDWLAAVQAALQGGEISFPYPHTDS